MNYRLAYAIGFHPWEDLTEHPPFAGKLLELVAREEDGQAPPYGPALDLGTGSGVWACGSPKRGWRVTGRRHRREGPAPRPRASRTRPEWVDLAPGRRDRAAASRRRLPVTGLILDTGTFHGLSAAQRDAMGREVDAIAAPRRHDPARLLRPPAQGAAAARRQPRRGRGRPSRRWEVTDVEVADTEPDALARLFKFDETLLPATPQRGRGPSAEEHDVTFVRANDVDLFTRDEHHTGEAIVLVHGGWDDHTAWNGVAPLLSERFRVVRYDRRGYGRTERPAGPRLRRQDRTTSPG